MNETLIEIGNFKHREKLIVRLLNENGRRFIIRSKSISDNIIKWTVKKPSMVQTLKVLIVETEKDKILSKDVDLMLLSPVYAALKAQVFQSVFCSQSDDEIVDLIVNITQNLEKKGRNGLSRLTEQNLREVRGVRVDRKNMTGTKTLWLEQLRFLVEQVCHRKNAQIINIP